MRFSLFLIFIICYALIAQGRLAPPLNDELTGAISLNNTTAFCSEDGAYNNLEATSSLYGKATNWPAVGKDVWFKFTASKYDVNISVSGQVNAASKNTLLNPLVALYTFDPVTGSTEELQGSSFTSNQVTSVYKGGLTIGQVYYIRVSAANDVTGTFKLCIDNYFPPVKPGQDCGTFSLLCTKETFTQLNVTGAGLNNRESAGTCLGQESNSAWYMFKASKAGTITFVITPTVSTNDIDWVFYDLGINGNCNNINSSTAIRCAAGSGVTCTPSYYKTGLSLTETDLTEASGCPAGQNGFVKYADLIEGHVYALMIDNFSSGNNGFTIEFGGTADFAGPTAEIEVEKLNPCTDNQAYVFKSKASNYASLKWSFGEGANMTTANGEGPFTITYSTPGEKVVVLEAKSTNGCNVVTTQNFIVAKTPDRPAIQASDLTLCAGDILKLSTPAVSFATYHWSGPNGFTSTLQNPELTVTGPAYAGTYQLYVQVGSCVSEVNTLDILSVDLLPQAEFSFTLQNACEKNQTYNFTNLSKQYTKLTWNFGDDVQQEVINADGGRSVVFQNAGLKTVSLTAETNNGCSATYSANILVEIKPDIPVITVNQPAFCLKDTIRLSVPEIEKVNFLWTGPNNFSVTGSHVEIPVTDFSQAGVYQVKLTLGSCSTDATIDIPPIARIPIAGFSITPSFNTKLAVPAFITFNNTSQFGDDYEWQFGDGTSSTLKSPTHTYQSEGTFKITLKAISKNGCWNSVTQGDLVLKRDASVFVPNTISPNGDGVNDELIINITNLKQYQLQIFNRLGNVVFTTNNIFENWKGDYKGNPLPVGVYYYLINGIDLDNKSTRLSGSLMLIR